MPRLSSFLPSTLALGVPLLASVALALARPRLKPEASTSTRFLVVVGLTILVQAVHFLEELRAEFYVRFPEAFGLQPFSASFFVWFNVAWLAIWTVSLLAVRAGFVWATCPLWFLGLAMVLNFVAHPLLALFAGGYFPGLLTAPLLGVLGALVLHELKRVTAPITSSRL